MRGRMRRAVPSRGFTLIELVVVMTIIAILAGAAVISINNRVRFAKRTRAISDIKTIETALGVYEADNGSAPTEQQGLQALLTKPTTPPEARNWQGPYLKKRSSLPKDPWGNDYVYKVTGENEYEVMSYGKDNQPGGTGVEDADVTSEEAQ